MPEDCHAALTLACINCLRFLYFRRMFSNILLGDKYRAKLSHFCALRRVTIDQTQITTHVLGRFGYLAAEYFRLRPFTVNLFLSFWVVLVELSTGEKEEKSLASGFVSHMENSCASDIEDSGVYCEKF